HAPATSDELAGKPIQQLRMRWRSALSPEVVFGFHQPHAEILLPEAIHGHAGGERVGGIDDPPSQVQAIQAHRLQAGSLDWVHDCQHSREYLSSFASEITLDVDMCRQGILGLHHHQSIQLLPFVVDQRQECFAGFVEERKELVIFALRDGVELVVVRSEEHTSELQSLTNLVCRLLLEKKKNNKVISQSHCLNY